MSHQPTPYDDAVVLIPGFLGFEQIGGFRYFAERVGAALRGAIAGIAGTSVPVLPVKTCPTEPLAQRQIMLINALTQLDNHLGHVKRLHLVGHSTGGVDAYQLTRIAPLAAHTDWQTMDPGDIRHKIRTVLTISSPHIGTCLALSPLARFFRQPVRNLDGYPALLVTLARLASALPRDGMAVGAVAGAAADAGEAGAYLLDVLRARDLVADLQPRNMADRHTAVSDLNHVQYHSVVTMVGARTLDYDCGEQTTAVRTPDAFFNDLYRHAAGTGFDDLHDNPDHIQTTLDLLATRQTDDLTIRHPGVELRPLSASLNDGLVNAARQVMHPNEPDELLAIVIADHIDVMGYYPQWVTRSSMVAGDRMVQLRSGILHSGSGFGDEQFFELMLRIARAIVPQTGAAHTVNGRNTIAATR